MNTFKLRRIGNLLAERTPSANEQIRAQWEALDDNTKLMISIDMFTMQAPKEASAELYASGIRYVQELNK